MQIKEGIKNRGPIRVFWALLLTGGGLLACLPCWMLAVFTFLYAGEIQGDPDPGIPIVQSVFCTIFLWLPIVSALFAKGLWNVQHSLEIVLRGAFKTSVLLGFLILLTCLALKYTIWKNP